MTAGGLEVMCLCSSLEAQVWALQRPGGEPIPPGGGALSTMEAGLCPTRASGAQSWLAGPRGRQS